MKPTRRPLHPVTLVGAGPGDPELLTIKAVRAIRRATVVLVDDLVGAQVLESVLPRPAPGVRVVHVGKRGGCASTPQAFIERLMVREALAGERVVRLKGGDPLVFGRAAEEMAALRAAGLEVRIVNGITAALAAATALDHSLTDRRCGAHGVLLVTGQCRPGAPGPDWPGIARLAAGGVTVVVYMGLARCADIQAELRRALPADWPAAVVASAGAAGERVVCTVLGDLADALSREGIASPAVLVVGPALADAVAQARGHSAAPAAAG